MRSSKARFPLGRNLSDVGSPAKLDRRSQRLCGGALLHVSLQSTIHGLSDSLGNRECVVDVDTLEQGHSSLHHILPGDIGLDRFRSQLDPAHLQCAI